MHYPGGVDVTQSFGQASSQREHHPGRQRPVLIHGFR